AVGMRRHLALEDEDFALRAPLAQVIVGAPVAEAELEDHPRQVRHQGHRQIEAIALCLQTAQGAFQTTHRAACAKRSCAVVCSRRCARTLMISTPISGKSISIRKNRSAVILRATSCVAACTVAVRGMPHRMAISPM